MLCGEACHLHTSHSPAPLVEWAIRHATRCPYHVIACQFLHNFFMQRTCLTYISEMYHHLFYPGHISLQLTTGHPPASKVSVVGWDAKYGQAPVYTAGKSPFRHLIYPLPEHGGLGVHLTLDMAGVAKFGPDVEWVDGEQYAVDPARADSFYPAIRTYFPGLKDGALAPSYSGKCLTDWVKQGAVVAQVAPCIDMAASAFDAQVCFLS